MKSEILETVARYPETARELFRDVEVVKALEAIGVLVTTFDLHAPSSSSRSSAGLGPTLCNDQRGRRHPTLVTCEKCLTKMDEIDK